ncbi:NAD(P)H-binding protein [Sphingomonas nostoxanthinifaciens]|uniref:NAD(P)H-binding protein n=1 Tax=Sphingomonas nostoxanthinifaciens TaxID=2872652 RepID=UPI001CC1E381|nr:NAD(P)H-binding protein [Sphingomonas nostoxanthinifaciens]UAK25238.1 NAD(P)H-binding protein [Sphingomonas nostoxanthinifaciens]
MYAVTGASGQLGRLVLDGLLETVEPDKIMALVRDPAKLAEIAQRGVIVRAFDYDAPETLAPALDGVERLLLISSNDVGRREVQHRAVIDAAVAAGVGFVAYTSILHADRNPLDLAVEHRATEAVIAHSGVTYALLRNGWYTENYTMSAKAEVAHGAVIGSAGEGRISAATRADYAAAAVAVLAGGIDASRTYELAGDDAFTLADYAATLAEVSGKPMNYVDMPEAALRAALEGMGLPAPWPAVLAETSAKTAQDVLFDDGHALSGLIGRPATPLIDAVKAALAG